MQPPQPTYKTSYVTWTLLTLQHKHKSYGRFFDYVIMHIFSSCCTARREDLPSVISSHGSFYPWHTSQLRAQPSSWLNIHSPVDCRGCMNTAAHGVPKELYESQGSSMTLKVAPYLLWECIRMLKRKQLAVATASFVTDAVRSAANEAADCKKKVKNGLMAKVVNDHIST